MERFIKQYFEDHPNAYKRIKALEAKRGLNLLGKRLSGEKNEVNFYSWKSEINFGFFFDTIATSIQYEKIIDGKEPDWTIQMNDQKFLAEVLRINAPQEELQKNMQKDKVLNDFIRDNPGVPIINYGDAKFMSSEYLYGHENKLTNKEISYRAIVNKYQLPFIICVESTIDTYVNDLDIFDGLIGNDKRGIFYKNIDFGRNVTGVLFRDYFGQFSYYHNELSLYKLNELNFECFNSIYYKKR